MNQPQLSYPFLLEKVAARFSAPICMPEPNSGSFSMRLSRFPVEGTETIIDLYTRGNRFFISVTRFLKPLRFYLSNFNSNIDIKFGDVPVEISIAETQSKDVLVREVFNAKTFELTNSLSDFSEDDHYFLFFTDSKNCVASAISNPYLKKDESWIRLINRSFGSELIPPRRKFIEKVI